MSEEPGTQSVPDDGNSCFFPDPQVLGHHNLKKNKRQTSLAPALTFSVGAHQAPIGAKEPNKQAAHIQDETCLSPPGRIL